MPNSYIKKIKEKKTGDIIYPESKTGAIYLSDNVTSLDSYLGSTDISAIGDGTVSGAISSLNSNLGTSDISTIGDGTITGAINSLNSKLQNAFITRGYHSTISSDTWYFIWNVNIAVQDYTPVGIVQVGSTQVSICITSAIINQDGTAQVIFAAKDGTTTMSQGNATLGVLYIRNSLM